MRSLLWVLALELGGCAPHEHKGSTNWRPVANAFATHFSILANGDVRRLIVLGHGGAGDTVGDYRVPPVLRRIAIISTTHAAFISALEETGRIVGGTQLDQVRDEALRGSIDAGGVVDIGTADGLDREKLVALKPDAVLGYPFGGENGPLKDLGIPVIQVSEYLEEHPLGRAEWIRFFGVLLGREHEADSLFKGIVERYEAVRRAVPPDPMPTVLFGSVWQGRWFVPPGNSYMAKLIEDAGGRYVFADRKSDGNITLDMETMIKEGSDADWWGMVTHVNGPVDAGTFTNGDERLSTFKSVREGHLFLGNAAEEDLFGQALLEPDELLSVLRESFDPGTVVDHPMGYRPRYFGGMYRTPPPPKIEVNDATSQ